MHEAVIGLQQVLDREKDPRVPYHVAACSEVDAVRKRQRGAREDLQLAIDSMPADFFIAPTHMRCDKALDGKVIVRIERMGTLIGVVKDRRAQTRSVRAAPLTHPPEQKMRPPGGGGRSIRRAGGETAAPDGGRWEDRPRHQTGTSDRA